MCYWWFQNISFLKIPSYVKYKKLKNQKPNSIIKRVHYDSPFWAMHSMADNNT